MRGETADDGPFLERLFISVRIDELGPTGWPEEAKHAFLANQFTFQRKHYANAYGGGDFRIVEQDGVPVGRLSLFWGADEVRVVDISLLPDRRGGGLGTALIRMVQADAAARGKAVSLHVDLMNPAQCLYRRLGFVEDGMHGPSWRMVWHPEVLPA